MRTQCSLKLQGSFQKKIWTWYFPNFKTLFLQSLYALSRSNFRLMGFLTLSTETIQSPTPLSGKYSLFTIERIGDAEGLCKLPLLVTHQKYMPVRDCKSSNSIRYRGQETMDRNPKLSELLTLAGSNSLKFRAPSVPKGSKIVLEPGKMAHQILRAGFRLRRAPWRKPG